MDGRLWRETDLNLAQVLLVWSSICSAGSNSSSASHRGRGRWTSVGILDPTRCGNGSNLSGDARSQARVRWCSLIGDGVWNRIVVQTTLLTEK